MAAARVEHGSELRRIAMMSVAVALRRRWPPQGSRNEAAHAEDVIDKLNAIHFVVRIGADEKIGREESDGSVVFQSPAGLSLRYANTCVREGVNKDGKPKLTTKDKFWINNVRR